MFSFFQLKGLLSIGELEVYALLEGSYGTYFGVLCNPLANLLKCKTGVCEFMFHPKISVGLGRL